ncbi:MAG: peptidoglycan-binding domain-containing protein [Planctomycetia bacterium]|nr:peptidoglycan-binding domain-containing protein [Planctomycetia bacterium]
MVLQSKWFTHPRFQDVASGRALIKFGERGDAVKTLQSALLQLGQSMPISTHKSGSPDGIFGDETDRCVKDFQRKALPQYAPDGKVGPLTLGQLDSRLITASPPKGSELVWGEAPPGVPGKPKEVDLGTVIGFSQAVRQDFEMGCWAACLSFWGRLCGGGRPQLSSGKVFALYSHLTSMEGPLTGGMPTGALAAIMRDEATPENVCEPGDLTHKWNGMVFESYAPATLTYDWLKHNASGPRKAIYFGYHIGGASHINVIGHYEINGSEYVWAMEPWDGRFKMREIEYYQSASRGFFAYPR